MKLTDHMTKEQAVEIKRQYSAAKAKVQAGMSDISIDTRKAEAEVARLHPLAKRAMLVLSPDCSAASLDGR